MRVNIDFFTYLYGREQFASLLRELDAYRNNNVRLLLDGKQSTPFEIANACTIMEEGCYMRDYVGDESGKIVEVGFDKIKNHEK